MKTKTTKNPELFQGESSLKKRQSYFEGWYFKHSSPSDSIAFIPGIHILENSAHAFIQIITTKESHFLEFPIEDFSFHHTPFYIQIGKNYFSKEMLLFDISKTDTQGRLVQLSGELYYSALTQIKKSKFSPNIMGPFSHLSFMECNHAILSMKHFVSGILIFNGKILNFDNGIGYIEKDWGTSFPSSYLWCQANEFLTQNTSFFFSCATIPLGLLKFQGLICVLLNNGIEYRFATYNNAKIKHIIVTENTLDVCLEKNGLTLSLNAKNTNSQNLLAPSTGKMNRSILESINSSVAIKLSKNKKDLYIGSSLSAGLEISQ